MHNLSNHADDDRSCFKEKSNETDSQVHHVRDNANNSFDDDGSETKNKVDEKNRNIASKTACCSVDTSGAISDVGNSTYRYEVLNMDVQHATNSMDFPAGNETKALDVDTKNIDNGNTNTDKPKTRMRKCIDRTGRCCGNALWCLVVTTGVILFSGFIVLIIVGGGNVGDLSGCCRSSSGPSNTDRQGYQVATD